MLKNHYHTSEKIVKWRNGTQDKGKVKVSVDMLGQTNMSYQAGDRLQKI